MAQLVRHHPAKQKVSGSTPSRGTCLGCRFHPRSEVIQKAANWCSSVTSMFFSLSFSIPSPLSKNKQIKSCKKLNIKSTLLYQWDRVENPEINPNIYCQWVFEKASRVHNGEMRVISTNGFGRLSIHMGSYFYVTSSMGHSRSFQKWSYFNLHRYQWHLPLKSSW